MGMMEQAAADLLQITTGDFGTDILFTPPTGSPKTIKGIGVKHHLKYDEYGAPISSKTTRISVSELALNAVGYTVRNVNKEVALIGHLVAWTDVVGNSWTYKIKITIPGETLGSIVCILDDYTP